MIETNQGRIRLPVLIISLLIVAAFILIAWMVIYRPPSTPIGIGNASSTIGGNASTTVTATTTTTSTVAKTPPPVAVTPPISDGHVIGIAAGGSLSKVSTSTLNEQLDQISALGAKWVRFDIEWGDVQYSSSSSFTWGSYDTLVDAIVAHHLNGLATILFTPQWARAPGCDNGVECPPANPATFATFAAEVAARYQGKVQAFEVWNEPNNYNFWAPHTNCAAYTTLLQATYPAIKQADPDAIVITGGLAPETTDSNNTSPTDFLSCVYKDGGEPYFDAVADHPYSFPLLPSQSAAGAWGQMSETMPSLRSVMVAGGDANKKIWITEFGTPTSGPDPQWYVSEASETTMVTDAMSLYKTYSWAGPFFWYTLKDGGTSTSTNENFFGLVRADGSLKPAYTTLQSIISAGL